LIRLKSEELLELEDRSKQARSTALLCTAELAVDVIHLKLVYPHFGPKKVRALPKKRRAALTEAASSRRASALLMRRGLCSG
jgi:hypothetical protein